MHFEHSQITESYSPSLGVRTITNSAGIDLRAWAGSGRNGVNVG